MRRKSLIALLLFVVVFVTAGVYSPLTQRNKTAKTAAQRQADSIRRDSLARIANDTTRMDSLQRAIYRHNKHVDDSIRLDSINRQKKNGIDAPVVYSGTDSLVYNAQSKMAYIYGTGKVTWPANAYASTPIAVWFMPQVWPIAAKKMVSRASLFLTWGPTNTQATPWPLTLNRSAD